MAVAPGTAPAVRSSREARLVARVGIAALLVGGALAGCSKSESSAGNPVKFCEASAKLNAASQNLLKDGAQSTDKKTAIKKFLEDQKGTIAEMRSAVPADLRDDFDESLRPLTSAGNGETAAPDETKLAAANKAMSDYSTANCKK